MVVTTESGSQYQFDFAGSRVRRLNESRGTSERAGHNGEWRTYLECTPPHIGQPMMIAWRYLEEKDILETTVTSCVVEISQLS